MRRVLAVALAVCGIAGSARADWHFSGNLGGAEFSFSINARPGGLLGGGWGLFDGGLLGHGGWLGGLGADWRQTRFESRFADIMAEYDDGLANIDDFYASDDYAEIVDDAEHLVDRYDWFVTGVERSVDSLSGSIDLANERLTFYDELLADYQERDLSEERLARITRWINFAQDATALKIDLLEERQADLTASLTEFREFQTTVTDYLDEIVAAAGGDGSAEAALTLASLAPQQALAVEAAVVAAAAPEPATVVPAALALLALVRRRRQDVRAA